jgi:hypothetical protein
MCDFISGYKLPDGKLHFHTDADVEAAYEKSNLKGKLNWHDYVGHSGYRFCFGDPPKGAIEVERLQYCLDVDLRQFRKLMKGAGYKSIILNDKRSVAKGRKLYAEGDKLYAEGSKLCAEGDKLFAEGDKLYAKGDKLYAKGDKLFAEGRKLCAEGSKLYAEGSKLCFTVEYL